MKCSIPATISVEASNAYRRFLDHFIAIVGEQPTAATKSAIDWKAQRAQADRLCTIVQPALDNLQPRVTESIFAGVPALHVKPRTVEHGSRALVYVHGGAYTMFSARSTLLSAAQMADAAKLEVYSIDYTLAPDANWRTITDQVVAASSAVMQNYGPKSVGMFGDSAGGALVAGSVLKMRDQGLPIPGALVLHAPWSDITATGDTYTTLADAEPILALDALKDSADAYADPADQNHPYVSPVYGDYSRGFPPTLIQGGTRDIFLSNFVRQYRAIVDAGGQATLDLYEGMPHFFFFAMGSTPEGRVAYAKAAKFWRDNLKD
jgi:epsilon-lactone hydrolase